MSEGQGPTAAERRQQRLAAALRANLGKRKARDREALITPSQEREASAPPISLPEKGKITP